MRFANHTSMKFPVEALSPDQEAPVDIFRQIGELGRLWKASESYSNSDMLLIRRIIQKQLSARLHVLKAHTEFPYKLPPWRFRPSSTPPPAYPHFTEWDSCCLGITGLEERIGRFGLGNSLLI
ncbi:hypothetical protein OAL10_11030 [Gammaproteobacteria bacterium]|nr:hypothetical protein [Gammaproteobacteria bacterium]